MTVQQYHVRNTLYARFSSPLLAKEQLSRVHVEIYGARLQRAYVLLFKVLGNCKFIKLLVSDALPLEIKSRQI